MIKTPANAIEENSGVLFSWLRRLIDSDVARRGPDEGTAEDRVAAAEDESASKVLERAALGADGDGPWAVLDEAGRLLAVYEPFRGTTIKPSVVLAAR